MDIPEIIIAEAARNYLVFAFDEGTADEIRAAKISFDAAFNDSYLQLTRSALMRGFIVPPLVSSGRVFITACRAYLRRKRLN